MRQVSIGSGPSLYPISTVFSRIYGPQEYFFLDKLRSIPTSKSASMRAVPPWLTKIRGVPDNGKRPSIEAIFMKDCPTM